MNLHEDKKLFRQSIRFTAQQMRLPEIFVEKDYWVTYALLKIFSDAIGQDTVFKGGTALSKCYSYINRFSEDIDLVVFRRDGETNSKLSGKIKTIGEVVSQVLPEVKVDGLTNKMGMNRKTVHSYPKLFKGNYGQVRDKVVVEATWLGYFEPHESRQVSSFVYNIMLDAKQNNLIDKHGMHPFSVLVLHPQRTICEKIMSLVRFSYDDDPIDTLQKKIRHLYDLHKLLQDEPLSQFFNSDAFEQMLNKVGTDDIISYKNNNDWLRYPPANALLFANSEDVWRKIKTAYEGDFQDLLYDPQPPSSEQILSTLLRIAERLSSMKWDMDSAQKQEANESIS